MVLGRDAWIRFLRNDGSPVDYRGNRAGTRSVGAVEEHGDAMKSRYLLRILTLAMPLLLGWIVVVGELNRVADRSPGVHASMIASRVDETAFTAPRLEFSDELLESH